MPHHALGIATLLWCAAARDLDAERRKRRQRSAALERIAHQSAFDVSSATLVGPGLRGADLAHCFAVVGVMSVGVRDGALVSGHRSRRAHVRARRDLIRGSYMRLPNVNRTVCVVFVLGEAAPGAPPAAALAAEAARHLDMVWVPAPDTVTGFKTYAWFRAAAALLPRACFVGKADDDLYMMTLQFEADLRALLRSGAGARLAMLGRFIFLPGLRYKGKSTRANNICALHVTFVDDRGPVLASHIAKKLAQRFRLCRSTRGRAVPVRVRPDRRTQRAARPAARHARGGARTRARAAGDRLPRNRLDGGRLPRAPGARGGAARGGQRDARRAHRRQDDHVGGRAQRKQQV
ncbi:hypothetical protein T492DRAFT_998378 [Pavlovales sp. CCMP2436]|nr:hypothetical protein T492DRAFT_998378 [Pavlovales sp. CCMP2436]